MSTAAVPRLKYERRTLTSQWATTNLASGVILLFLLWVLWSITARPVQVTVDGVTELVPTHRHTVGALLVDVGIRLQPSDRVAPPVDTSITSGLQVRIDRAWPMRVLTDGRDLQLSSWGKTPREVLTDAGLAIDRYDQVLVDDHPLDVDEPLPLRKPWQAPATYNRGYAWQRFIVQPLQLRVHRAIPIRVNQDGLDFTVRTTAQTVGEALREAGLILYLGDRVHPSLGSRVNTGLHVYIERSTPVTMRVDGRTIKTRTRAKTVGDALTETGFGLSGLDMVTPTLVTKLYPDIKIMLTRVREDIVIKEEIVPFETVFEASGALPIDTQQVTTLGAEGITRHRYRVRYEDDQEAKRVLEDTWVAQDPVQQVISYGQQVEPQTMTAADGTQITYWRKIRMYATSYSAGTAGVDKDNTSYGRTFTGDQMRSGVVAVDAGIVPLRSRVYVPGYGFGDALDTGSAIRSRRIDLGYDDNNLVSWSRWVDVYLLWPPPPAYQITWVLPNWPRIPDQ